MMLNRIKVVHGDITSLALDAIVNAANETMLGGGGVDGAIHKAAGPELLVECRKLGGCATGDAKITKGYKLPSRHVIHTVGPVWCGGTSNEDELLSKCYRRSLEVAVKNELVSIAFPAISTGAYLFPVSRASKIAVQTVVRFLLANQRIKEVVFCCFAAQVSNAVTTELAEYF